ncbi:MAG TPA: trypsin-like peptidase domain-containing protein [Acidimicrobiales bacterium]
MRTPPTSPPFPPSSPGPPAFPAPPPPASPPPPAPPASPAPIPPPAPAGRPGPTPGPRRPGRRAAAAVVVASLLAGSAGGWAAARAADDPSGAAGSAAAAATPASSRQLSGDELDVAAVVAHLQGSVVAIETTVVARRGPFPVEGRGAGTGVVVGDGLVLTNAHVVDGAESVAVTATGDHQPRPAEVVGADPSRDVAVLRVDDPSGLTVADIGDSDALAVGDDVVAIGNALALEGSPTVTRGIVSALGRELDTGRGTLSGLIQTDAAISSGNSGGPLVDAAGQVVGINTAAAVSGQGIEAANIGFAIPIDAVHEIVGAAA